MRVVLPALASRGELALLDALRRRVWQQLVAGEAVVPVVGLPPGLYVLRLTAADGRVWTGKLMREQGRRGSVG